MVDRGAVASLGERFVQDGFVRIDEGFSRSLADACRAILWRALGHAASCAEDDPSTWRRPVVRIGEIPHPSFREAANTPRLCAAYDELVGTGRWSPRSSVGTFPIRFPSTEDPGDCGFHVDMSFGFDEHPDFLDWRINVRSKGRALLLLFLFSDVGPNDAPTRLRVGSHLDVARSLAAHGDAGLTLRELARDDFADSAHRPEVTATGPAGTVYLCHPFLVHAAQPLRPREGGVGPRFLAQPALLPRTPLDPWRTEAAPVERAIRLAIEGC